MRRRGIARRLVFQDEDDSLLLGFGGSLAQLFIHGIAIRRLILEAPEIETADAIGTERFGHGDRTLKNFVLLVHGVVGVEALGLTVLRFWGAGPVDLEQWTRDVGNSELKFSQQAAALGHIFFIESDDVLFPHAAELDPSHTE